VKNGLEVRARTRTADGDDWGLYFVWADAEGWEHTWTMACELLATDGSPILQELRRCGLNIAYLKNIRELILTYIAGCKPAMIITSVSRTGWNGDSYGLPDETIGGSDSEGTVVRSYNLPHMAAEPQPKVSMTQSPGAGRPGGPPHKIVAGCEDLIAQAPVLQIPTTFTRPGQHCRGLAACDGPPARLGSSQAHVRYFRSPKCTASGTPGWSSN
jgi:hypothetical protein